jgi:hypothetical protein
MNGLFESTKKRRERSGRVVGRSVQDLAAAILVIGTGSSLASTSNRTPG